jgi:hypothetical protein
MANVEGILKIRTRGYIEFDWRTHDLSLLPHIAIGPAAERLERRSRRQRENSSSDANACATFHENITVIRFVRREHESPVGNSSNSLKDPASAMTLRAISSASTPLARSVLVYPWKTAKSTGSRPSGGASGCNSGGPRDFHASGVLSPEVVYPRGSCRVPCLPGQLERPAQQRCESA